jgi:hypothetical protein
VAAMTVEQALEVARHRNLVTVQQRVDALDVLASIARRALQLEGDEVEQVALFAPDHVAARRVGHYVITGRLAGPIGIPPEEEDPWTR